MNSFVTSQLFMPLSKIKGVGEKRYEDYKRLGITNIRDALFHLPISYIYRKPVENVAENHETNYLTFIGEVVDMKISSSFSKRAPSKVVLSVGNETVVLVYFHLPTKILREKFKVGSKYVISGKVDRQFGTLQIVHPEYVYTYGYNADIPKVEPVYPLTYKLTNKMVGTVIKAAIANSNEIPEWLPKSLVESKKWLGWNDSVKASHNPKTRFDFDPKALHRERIAFDELLAQQLSLQIARKNVRRKLKKPLEFSRKLEANLRDNLPFKLTKDQDLVIEEILNDLKSEYVMNRVVQGDVGCGKTLVALCVMLNVVEHGGKAAIMAPTEILAKQHYEKLKEYCEELEVEVLLLCGSLKISEKRKVLTKIMEEKPLIVVGTHSLFQDKIEFNNLKVAIIDEQHRFGVEQRVNLAKKNENLDFLMMSATPIPRTTQMLNYGDLDLSVIKTKPANRKEIVTTLLSENKISDLEENLRNIIDRGEKVYWVCPLVKESEKLDLANIEDRFVKLNKVFEGKVAFVHGKIAAQEREKLMDDFKNGNKQILIATTVIEVGVDVPDATVIVIENAERFGLSQLHQLRGRVGRGDKQSYCILMYSKNLKGENIERLKVMKKTSDGFVLAEEDLRIRGGGEVLGYKQSGLPSFKIADPQIYNYLIKDANKLAKYILEMDPELDGEFKNIRFLLEIFEFNRIKELLSQN